MAYIDGGDGHLRLPWLLGFHIPIDQEMISAIGTELVYLSRQRNKASPAYSGYANLMVECPLPEGVVGQGTGISLDEVEILLLVREP